MKKIFKGNKQPSDTFRLTFLLSIVGGLLDAYTFLVRGKVLANAQTGNIVYLAIYLGERNIKKAIFYLFPILAFGAGIFISEVIRGKLAPKNIENENYFHWRQIGVFIEIIILLIVGFISKGKWDLYVNIIVSFIASIQYQTFKKSNGVVMATTMCTGNFRSSMEHLYIYTNTKNKRSLHLFLKYIGMILSFILGGLLCVFLVNFLNTINQSEKAILAAVPILLLVSYLMTKKKI